MTDLIAGPTRNSTPATRADDGNDLRGMTTPFRGPLEVEEDCRGLGGVWRPQCLALRKWIVSGQGQRGGDPINKGTHVKTYFFGLQSCLQYIL